MVCVSNVQNLIQLAEDLGQVTDRVGMVFDLCWGAVRDKPWFRQVTTLVPDPDHRGRFIDFAGDWWYVDDLAKEYLERENSGNLFVEHCGKRILVPEVRSGGTEILRWLRVCCAAG